MRYVADWYTEDVVPIPASYYIPSRSQLVKNPACNHNPSELEPLPAIHTSPAPYLDDALAQLLALGRVDC